jgi:hypothetical protein
VVAQGQVGPPSPGNDQPAGIRFNVFNNGQGGATVTLSIGGPDDEEFAITNTNCGFLSDDSSCQVWVVFKPASAGRKSAKLIATPDNGTGATATLDGFGTVSTGGLLIEPPQHDYGSVDPQTGGSFTFTVRNVGQLAFTSVFMSIPPPPGNVDRQPDFHIQFTEAPGECNGRGLAPAESCTIRVDFNPRVHGQLSSVLNGTALSGNQTVGTATANLFGSDNSI